MNWLRDNIVKVLVILGSAIVLIVILALVFTPKEDNTVKGSKYGELETKLQNAAVKYIDKHRNKLPKEDETTKVTLKTLISNNYIGTISAVDNSNVKCDGYVEITKIEDKENTYRYTPYITCGEYYVTKTIGDYIIDSETKDGTFNRTSDAGLYKMGDEYIFRGEKVNNYLLLDEHPYRIIKIDKDKQLQLISMEKTDDSYVWDDRYNIEKDSEDGINVFIKSRLYESLSDIYENSENEYGEALFSSTEKEYITPHDYCIGKRSVNDGNIYSGTECNETASLKVGIISINEYARASIDSNCNNIYDKSCANYNYFNALTNSDYYNYTSLTAVADNTYEFFRVRYGEVETATTAYDSQLYPVIYINTKTIYSSGTGTAEDPYIVR